MDELLLHELWSVGEAVLTYWHHCHIPNTVCAVCMYPAPYRTVHTAAKNSFNIKPAVNQPVLLCWFSVCLFVIIYRSRRAPREHNTDKAALIKIFIYTLDKMTMCAAVSLSFWDKCTLLVASPLFCKANSHTLDASQFRVCILRRSNWRTIMSQHRAKSVPIRRLLQMQPTNAPSFSSLWRMNGYYPSWPHISQDSLQPRKRRKKERKWRHRVV